MAQKNGKVSKLLFILFFVCTIVLGWYYYQDYTSIKISLIFGNIQNLKVGNEVILHSAKIGKVINIAKSYDNKFAVTVKISKEYQNQINVNSVGYIKDDNQNPQGKLLELYIDKNLNIPVENGAILKGIDNDFELKAWQVKNGIKDFIDQNKEIIKKIN